MSLCVWFLDIFPVFYKFKSVSKVLPKGAFTLEAESGEWKSRLLLVIFTHFLVRKKSLKFQLFPSHLNGIFETA